MILSNSSGKFINIGPPAVSKIGLKIFVGFFTLALPVVSRVEPSIVPFSFEIKSGLPKVAVDVERAYASRNVQLMK